MLSSGRIKLGEVYLSGINGLRGERVGRCKASLKLNYSSCRALLQLIQQLFSSCYLHCMLGIRLVP